MEKTLKLMRNGAMWLLLVTKGKEGKRKEREKEGKGRKRKGKEKNPSH